MSRTVLVISDSHLGGEPGFQICSPEGRVLLADFLDWVATLVANGEDIHLVVNGDLVDFLAEPPFSIFTSDDVDATEKLQSIIDSSKPVWDAFAKIAGGGAEITILLGNHDLELTLPGPNTLLRRTLGNGTINLIFDNQALDLGDVLIEHGNRYDAWNVVDHNALRQIRSAMSRRETPEEFPAPAGSRLVIDVMNEVKSKLRFVDLLKPENDAVLPLLAALAPVSGSQIKSVIRYYKEMKQVRYGAGQTPLDSGNISDTDEPALVETEPGERLADSLLDAESSDDAGDISFSDNVDFFQLWHASKSPARREQLIDRLYVALRHRLAAQTDAFQLDLEAPEYVSAAETSAANGFKVVVYGHTHLAKRVPLSNGGVYLNTGTWADIMMLPRAVVQGNRLAALGELASFVDDLEKNELDTWRRQVPTFARIEMDGRTLVSADVLVYAGKGVSHSLSADAYDSH